MPLYAPGSFSKNFAWHHKGFSKLHSTIRKGFGDSLSSVRRDIFLSNCGIDDTSLRLIPVNFFLHNTILNGENFVTFDELVFHALFYDHNFEFDRLSLFSIHLSRTGKRVGKENNRDSEHATQWIRDFVQKSLWNKGYWRKENLSIENMDKYIENVLDAKPEVRRKCRSNYRHMLELCNIPVNGNGYIESYYEKWIGSAFFLAFDRYLIDKNLKIENLTNGELISYVKDEEIYKLIGIPEDEAISYANLIVKDYLKAGAVNRFSGPIESVTVSDYNENHTNIVRKRNINAPKKAIELKKTEEEERGEVQRIKQVVESQVRDAKISYLLKELYGFKCMICGERIIIDIEPERYYAETAHIKGLGKPENGPDITENMIVLCPNHHKQFDNGILTFEFSSHNKLIVHSKVQGDSLEGKLIYINESHSIDEQYINWHKKRWE